MLPKMVRLILFVVMLLANNKLAHGLTTSNAKIRCIEREKQTLLKFRQTLVDHYDVLSSWGIERDKRECCEWRGVTCNNQTGHVTVLDLHTSEDYLSGEISPSLFELQHLKYLDLSGNCFEGNFSPIPKNLSCLRYLNLRRNDFYFCWNYHLSGGNDLLSGGNLKWLSYFPLLRHLDLYGVNLSQAINWVEQINNLPLLENLNLARCGLPNLLFPAFPFNFSTSPLAVVDLSFNFLSSSVYRWLVNFSSTLVDVNLERIHINGSIPCGVFDKMRSLVHLNLGNNQLEGGIPRSFMNLSCLQSLELQWNQLADGLPEFLDKLSGLEKSLRILNLEENQITGNLPDFTRFSSLEELDLTYNQLTGPFPKSFRYVLPNLVTLRLYQNMISGMLPDLTVFPSLTELDLWHNMLNGSIDKSIGQLSKLKYLDASFNSLQGIISETHFLNLSSLKYLDFSFNQLVFNITPNWIPLFQLDVIRLGSCKLGPYFPKWLQNQSNFSELDISEAGISDVVPFWFWNLPPTLVYLNLSYNQMNGPLPDLRLRFFDSPTIDLSSNLFRGQLPRVPSNVTSLNLSKNLFSGSILFICAITGFRLEYLDLSSNQLSGALPDCWERFQELGFIILANNTLSGKLPSSWGSLYQLKALQLRNNDFSGELPKSLKNCMELGVIDLEGNRFKGEIQPWIGTHFANLIVLSLRFNEFYGAIPRTICHLNYIQVLDLSQNHFSGKLPRCFNNFSALVRSDDIFEKAIGFTYNSGFLNIYQANAMVQWKGQEREYGNTLRLLKFIDLSSNNFSGKIPQEIARLEGLLSLNLSRNDFTGKIIENIDQMKMLESLDLSANRLFGEIPTAFAHLNFLSLLDLSHNNLSGKIPLGTQLQSFNPSAYFGNPLLCGVPLPKKCPGEEKAGEPPVVSPGNEKRIQEEEDEDNKIITKEFYISMGVGFAFGFWAIFGTMLFSSMSRYAFFKFLDKVPYWFYDTLAVTFARLQRRLQG